MIAWHDPEQSSGAWYRRWFADDGSGFVWMAARDDGSYQDISPINYDSTCSFCWLGHGHTRAAHVAAIVRAARREGVTP